MKKNILYLCLFTLAGLTAACGNDDNEGPDPGEGGGIETVWDGTYPASEADARTVLDAALTTAGDAAGRGEDYRYTLSTASQLAAMAYLVNRNTEITGSTTAKYNRANYLLAADFDLAGHPWTPIGNYDICFMGTFDGRGHVVRNLNATDKVTGERTNALAGFIGNALDSVISYLIVEGAVSLDVQSGELHYYSGGICSVAGDTDIRFCRFNGTVTSTSDNRAENYGGGIVSSLAKGELTGCIGNGSVTVSGGLGTGAGGLMGTARYTTITFSAWNAGLTTHLMGDDGLDPTLSDNNSYTDIAGLNALLDGINAGVPDSEFIWQAGAAATDYPVLVPRR